jgi:hypothetical protein
MNLDEQFDPDEILRDVGDIPLDSDEIDSIKEVRELNFGTLGDQNDNFRDMPTDYDNQ